MSSLLPPSRKRVEAFAGQVWSRAVFRLGVLGVVFVAMTLATICFAIAGYESLTYVLRSEWALVIVGGALLIASGIITYVTRWRSSIQTIAERKVSARSPERNA
jgi:hypothetical protein